MGAAGAQARLEAGMDQQAAAQAEAAAGTRVEAAARPRLQMGARPQQPAPQPPPLPPLYNPAAGFPMMGGITNPLPYFNAAILRQQGQVQQGGQHVPNMQQLQLIATALAAAQRLHAGGKRASEIELPNPRAMRGPLSDLSNNMNNSRN